MRDKDRAFATIRASLARHDPSRDIEPIPESGAVDESNAKPSSDTGTDRVCIEVCNEGTTSRSRESGGTGLGLARQYNNIEKCIERICGMVTKLGNSSTLTNRGVAYEDASFIRSHEKHAKSLVRTLKQWQKQLPPEQQSEIKLEAWQEFERTLPNARTFSKFLSILYGGFRLDFLTVFLSCSLGKHKPSRKVFAESRLLPVLVAMQQKPLLAQRIFCLAEDGLGSCHDRPTLTFIDIELEVRSDQKISELCNIFERDRKVDTKICNEFIAIEHQKFRKSRVISSLIKNIRDAEDGHIDPLQRLLNTYHAVTKKEKDHFLPLPYLNLCSFINKKVKAQIISRSILNYKSMESFNVKGFLREHLMVSDNWLKFLIIRNPQMGKVLERLEEERTRCSEKLLDMPEAEFQDNYAREIQALQAWYLRIRWKALYCGDSREFTETQVEHYLAERGTNPGRIYPLADLAHYMRLGAETPNTAKPLASTVATATNSATRAVFNATSSMRTRSAL